MINAARILTEAAYHLHPGLRCWHDVHYYAGWRVQEHVKTGKFRVVPPSPLRDMFTADTRAECLSMIAQRRAKGLKPAHDHFVLIVPGLNGLPVYYMMLQFMIRRAGYDCMVWHYGSNHTNAAGHAGRLAALVNGLEGVKTISFVTHSLGGLILRVLLADDGARPQTPVNGIVMIAPPHGGSFLADLVHDRLKLRGLYDWVCGRVGHDLTSAGAAALPPVTAPVGIMTGGVAGTDGLVSVASSLIPAATDTTHIQGWSHTLMLWNPETARRALRFLRTERFLPAGGGA